MSAEHTPPTVVAPKLTSLVAIVAVVACGMLMLAFIGLSASRSQLYINEMNRQIVYGEQVMSGIYGLLIEVIDAQAHARGYAISGDEQIKTDYLENKTNSNAKLEALRKLMADSPHQQQQFARIEASINAELQWLQQTWLQQAVDIKIDAVRSKQIAHGEVLMDSLHSTLDQIANEHRQITQQLKRESPRLT